MYAKILLMTAFLLTGQAFAAEPTTETKTESAPQTLTQKTLGFLKEHFSFIYHGEYVFVRRDVDSVNPEDHKIKDLNILHNPTIIYNPTKNWSLLSTAEFKYSDQQEVAGPTYNNSFYRALVTLTRKNILVEKENGVQLDVGVGRRVFNSSAKVPSFGNNRAFATLTKNYGKNNGSLMVQYLHNDYKKSGAATWKHGLELVPTINIQLTEKLTYLFNDDMVINQAKESGRYQEFSTSHEMNIAYLNYQLTDKVNVYYQFKYLHNSTFDIPAGGHLNSDSLEHYAGVGYAFTPKITLTVEVGSEIIKSGDGRDAFLTDFHLAKKASYPQAALYLDASF